MASSIPSFLFGAGTKYKTQEELERAREQVRDMLGDIGDSGLTGWGSFMADLGKGISAGIEGRRINEGQEIVSADQERLWNSFPGYEGGADPDAIVAASGTDTVAGGVGGDIDTGANARSVDLSGDKAAFVSALMPAAVEHGARIGVDPRIIVAQAAQETGWGKHAPNNNYFGIKSHGKGGGQTFATNEVINGKRVTVNDSFRKFNSPADSVAGYADFLASNKRYGPMRSAQGIDAQLRALGASGYATDPNYAASVGAIARSLPLTGGGGASGQAGGAGTDPMVTGSTTPPPQPGTAFRNAPITTAGLRTPGGADFLSRMGSPAPMAQQQLPMVPPDPRLRMVNPASMSGGPQPLPMVPGRSGGPMPSLQQPVPPPQPPQPVPAPPPAPAPAPPAPPAPPPNVDPFTDMILGDKAGQFKPGNYIPPAPVGQQVFPAAPPAPGTPAAAGFGVPPVVGGGGAEQLAGKGTFPPAPAPPQAQAVAGGDKIAKLMFVLSSPYASDEQKRMATAMLQREYALEDERRKAAADAANPLTKLELEKAQLEVEKLRKGEKRALINAGGGMLYDQDTGEWIQAPAGPGGGGPFSSDSVEADALNGMVANGTLTVQQAYAIAAGKVITDPETGRMIFKTPQGLVGAVPGQQPQLIVPAEGGQPAAAQPGTSAQPGTVGESGGTVLTGGKPGKMATEAETRARALYTVASPEMKTVEQMFPALGDMNNQMYSQMPWNTGNWGTSEEYQRGKNALMTIIQSYMYVTSGASAPDAEVERNANSLMPQMGEKPGTVKDKLARIQNYVRAIKMAGGQQEDAPAAGGGRLKFNPATGELE